MERYKGNKYHDRKTCACTHCGQGKRKMEISHKDLMYFNLKKTNLKFFLFNSRKLTQLF